MSIKELQLKIELLEKEVAELKLRQPITILPQQVCPLQHYPFMPQITPNYPYQNPATNHSYYCDNIIPNIQGGLTH